MDKKLAWKTMTNTERREVLEYVDGIQAVSADPRRWDAVVEALQSIAPTEFARRPRV